MKNEIAPFEKMNHITLIVPQIPIADDKHPF